MGYPLSSLALKLSGWKFEGERPSEKKFVCLAVPHTSNWDGLILVAVARTLGLNMAWMIKQGSWTRGPMGKLLAKNGAVAVDRSKANNLVDQMVTEMQRRDELMLVIPPEGTRKRAEHWKSGFYHIARGANVPVVPGYLDYERKRAGLGQAIHLSGDVRADMDQIRAYYEKHAPVALVPSAVGPMRLREEG